MTRRQQRPSHSLTPHPQGPPVVPWGAVLCSPGGQCVPWGWPSGDRTHTPQTPPLSGLSPPLSQPGVCLHWRGRGRQSLLQLPEPFLRPPPPVLGPLLATPPQQLTSPLLWNTSSPQTSTSWAFLIPIPAPRPFSSTRHPPPTQHPQPEAPSVHLPSPRAGKARPVSLRNWPLEAQPGWRTTVVRTQSWASTLPSPGSNEPPSTGETGENSVGK